MRRAGAWFLGLLILAVAAIGVVAVLRRTLPTDTIRIASILPRGGPSEASAEAFSDGIVFALEEANFRAGRFRLAHRDLDSRSAEALVLARDASVVGVIAGLGALKARELAERLQAGPIAVLSTDSEDAGPFLRLVPRDEAQGTAAAAWIRRMGLESAFLVDDDPLGTTGITRSFRDGLKAAGLAIAGDEKYFRLYADDTELFRRIAREEPPLVYLSGLDPPSAASFVWRLRSAGYAGRIMMSNRSMNAEFLVRAGAAAEGVLFTSPLRPPPAEFALAYRASRGEAPSAETWLGYHAARTLLDAVEKAGTRDTPAVRAACVRLPFFDDEGEPARPVLGAYRVRDGRFEPVEELRP
jgi:branched-chain amino acid transport system substrate-binding protein